MKKLFGIAIVIFSILSCESEDFFETSGTEVETISFANVPEELILGETYEFDLTVDLISDCHSFNRFETETVNEQTIVIGPILDFEDNLNCELSDLSSIEIYEYTANSTGEITFRFLTDNTSGNQLFIEKEVTVIEP